MLKSRPCQINLSFRVYSPPTSFVPDTFEQAVFPLSPPTPHPVHPPTGTSAIFPKNTLKNTDLTTCTSNVNANQLFQCAHEVFMQVFVANLQLLPISAQIWR